MRTAYRQGNAGEEVLAIVLGMAVKAVVTGAVCWCFEVPNNIGWAFLILA
jgi:hypothetical protein